MLWNAAFLFDLKTLIKAFFFDDRILHFRFIEKSNILEDTTFYVPSVS